MKNTRRSSEVVAPEALRVYVRMRPPPTEADGWCLSNSNKVQRASRGCEIYRNEGSLAWQWDRENIVWSLGPHRAAQRFQFSQIYGMHVGTSELYREVGFPVVQRVFEGYNGCIMAYGQTNSGKTHTISGTKPHAGIITLAVKDVFEHIRQTPDRVSLLRISFLEVYNEQLKDLLADYPTNLIIVDDHEGRVRVGNATERVVASLEEVEALIAKGEACRMFGRNNVHEHASRSHTIFQLTFESRQKDDATVHLSNLNIVDLAGSEYTSLPSGGGRDERTREKKELDKALQQIQDREGNNIRKSLLALTRVVNTLATSPKEHIPYRDSKLTRILGPALGGNSSTAIIATINPWMSDSDDKETLATLRFACTAQLINNHPQQITLTKDGLLEFYQNELRVLQDQMLMVNAHNWGVIQEKETLAERLDQQELRRQSLHQKYLNLSQFLLTARSGPPPEQGPAQPHRLSHRRRSFHCLRDIPSLSLVREYGGLKEKPDCGDCALKDCITGLVEQQRDAAQFKLKESEEQQIKLRIEWERATHQAAALSGQLSEAHVKSGSLERQLSSTFDLEEERSRLQLANEKLESDVVLALKGLEVREAALQQAIATKVSEVEAKEKDLKEYEDRTIDLKTRIKAQQKKNKNLDQELKQLTVENQAFQRYYEDKMQTRHFKTIRRMFGGESDGDKPWLQYMPPERRISSGPKHIPASAPADGPSSTP